VFLLKVRKNQLLLIDREPITSGSLHVNQVCFQFSSHWDGLEKTAMFRAGERVVSLLLDESDSCFIPWEVLENAGGSLGVGVCGRLGEEVVLPTVWCSLGPVWEGAAPGETARPPTPDLWRQELARRANRMAYTPKGELGLYADHTLLASVPLTGGGGGQGPDYVFGHGFLVKGGVVTVHTAQDFAGDNTLPITAAAVESTLGNIAALLETI